MDKHYNTSQAKSSSGGGGFGHENLRDYGGSQPSRGRFGGNKRINSAFGFGGGPSSCGGFGKKNIDIV